MKIYKTSLAVCFWILCVSGALAHMQDASVSESAKHGRRLAQQRAAHEYGPAQWGSDYADFKKALADKTGLQYGVDISYLLQRGAPSGKQTSVQGYYYPYLTWDLFKNTAWGSGQLNVNYTLIHYWGLSGSALQNRLGLLSGQNDDTADEELFSQFTYTHTLPGKLSWLSVTAGQFPLYNFDGTAYLANQQAALLNESLSQNASSTYADAGFGAYLQAAAGAWTLSAGWQDASNISGQTIRLRTAFGGEYTWFGSLSYAPDIKGLGAGQYSFLYYYQPSVAEQEGISRGWSFNASQNLGEKWVLSARANGSDGNVAEIKNSYALALTWLNPLERNANDAVTLGVAYNRADGEALGYPPYWRSGETAVELQWVWGIGTLMTLTPDVQFYPDAGLAQGHPFVTVASLRTTIML